MNEADLARGLAAHLRQRGAISDAQIEAAGRHFAAGVSPVECLARAGVPRAEIEESLRAVDPPAQRTEQFTASEPGTLVGVGGHTDARATGAAIEQTSGPFVQARGAAAVPLEPTRFGPWRVVRTLGSGAMGAVHLAEDDGGRTAAVKTVHAHLLNIPEARVRFAREVQATRKVKHANVVEVLDVSSPDAPVAYLAVEYVDGGTIGALLRKHTRLPLAAALEIFAQTLAGLEAAHALQVIHRDLKPENLLLTSDGVVKIADFGIARELDVTAMTQTGSTLGTPVYMSPEQARAQTIDGRSDLYTAGVILYELLTGRNPFEAEALGTVIANILLGKAPPLFEVDPSIPEPIDALVAELMRGNPDARPPNAAAVLARIAPFLEDARRDRPRLLRELLASPQLAVTLKREQATSLILAARQLLQMGPGQREAAGLCLLRARLLDEGNAEASALLAGLAQQGVVFGGRPSAKLAELEAELANSPDDPVLLQRTAQAYKQEGDVYKAAIYFRRYLRVRPEDQYVQGQLSRITMMASSTVERIAGHVNTGGIVTSAPTLQRLTAEDVAAQSPRGAEAPAVVDDLRASFSVHGGKLMAAAVVAGVIALGVLGVRAMLGGAQASIEEARQGTTTLPKDPSAAGEAAAQAALDRARAALEAGRDREAVDQATAALAGADKATRTSSALVVRARAFIQLKKPLAAVEDLTRVIDRYRDQAAWAEALIRRGQAYAAAGDAERALADLTRGLEDRPTQPLASLARVERGLLYAAAGERAKAKADLERARDDTAPGNATHVRALEALATLP